MNPSHPDFVGAKAALLSEGRILVYLRDEIPGLPWAGHWDVPGGGREGQETAEECLLRELWEEFGLRLDHDRLVWRRTFPSIMDQDRASVFFGGVLFAEEVAAIRFGTEGQLWDLMPVADFLSHPKAVPEMQRRTAMVWNALVAGKA